MELTTITKESINREIDFCTDFIDTKKDELSKFEEKFRRLTERLNVLTTIEEKLPEGLSKKLTQHNITVVANERFELAPKLSNLKSNIEGYYTIIDSLVDLRSEI
ncbi:hypothetical protein [Rummeliibacillus sp. POC4]|uniref:hypothetical protein n=1 Tax=Rummeliibacillus sp. POC4 TaxID=2305899 RepID=UPI000E65EF79|nr:hypothetical protein [Rummeliibacillus sp. POC4]RIJ65544.1 hypothetical protein D1606_08215 [Rummeliibacillus sp. POC4]